MIKYYEHYGFPSDPIVDFSRSLIYIALNITWNNFNDVYTFSWMIDITCAILSMNVHFNIKRQVNILYKIPSDSNARNIILYYEFFNAVLGHAIRTLPGMNEKTQSYIFTSGSRRLRTRVPWRSTWKLMCCFLIVTNARQILTMVDKFLDVPFEWGINIDMYYRLNFLSDQATLLKSSWYFPK